MRLPPTPPVARTAGGARLRGAAILLGAAACGASALALDPPAALVARFRAEAPVPSGPWSGIGEATEARAALAARERELLARLRSGPDPAVDRELGEIYTQAGETQRGVAYLARAIEGAPGDVRGWTALGANRLFAGELERARVLLGRARELGPDDAAAHHFAGDLARREGRVAEAREELARAVELAPGSTESRVLLATVLEELGELEAARAELLAAREESPDDPRAHYLLSRVARALGRVEEARAAAELHARLQRLDDLAVRGPRADRFAALGIHLLTTGRPAEALVEFEEALASSPSRAVRTDGLLGRSSALIELGEAGRARAAVDELAALAPGHPDLAALEERLARLGD